jgi:hypothetical protein
VSDIDELTLRIDPDAQAWAKAFMSVFHGRSGDIDEGTMIGWFANYRFVVQESITHEAHNAFVKFVEDTPDLGWEDKP